MQDAVILSRINSIQDRVYSFWLLIDRVTYASTDEIGRVNLFLMAKLHFFYKKTCTIFRDMIYSI